MDARGHPGTDHGHHHDSHGAAFDSDAGVAHLEVEGEAFSGFTAEAVRSLKPLLEASGLVVRRVVDLGCGPGVASCDLAEMLAPALVVAADSSAPMRERAAARAARFGLEAQIETRHVDLDVDVRSLGCCDVVYASMALHHAADEVATLGQIRSLLEPRGLLCVLERADPPAVRLADERGRAGIWSRLDVAWQRWCDDRRGQLPAATRTDTYPMRLAAAGFELRLDATVGVAVGLSGNTAAQRFAVRHLQRAHVDLVRYADAVDLEVLPDLVRAMSASSDRWEGAIHSNRKLIIATPAPGLQDGAGLSVPRR